MIGIPPLSPAILEKWNELRRYQRQKRAHRKLSKLIEQRRESFEITDFRRRRAAALKGKRGG